jgi:hypothetical protein
MRRHESLRQDLLAQAVGQCQPDRDIYFGPLRLGRFHERTLRIEDALGRHYRRRY